MILIRSPVFKEEYIEVITNFIKEKVTDASSKGVVLGLSGGLDSSVVATLCARALGPKNVHCLVLPEDSTPKTDIKDAEAIAEELGVNMVFKNISSLVHKFVSLCDFVSAKTSSIPVANVKARLRMVILYYYANANNLLVAGTSNKSEFLLGYFTKYGDGASDIAPIGDMYKTQVRECAKYIGIPDSIIKKKPTAGLITGVNDEDELGADYEILDRILFALETGIKIEIIAHELGVEASWIEEINRRVELNRHKRKFTKIPKLGFYTVGTDLRE